MRVAETSSTQVRERLQVVEMEQSATRAEQRTLATSEAVLQLERDVAQQLHRHLERISSFETDRLGAAVSRIHGLQAIHPPAAACLALVAEDPAQSGPDPTPAAARFACFSL